MVDVITTEEDVISLIVYKWQMLLPFDVVEDVKPHNCMLQCIIIIFMGGVIAKWQME